MWALGEAEGTGNGKTNRRMRGRLGLLNRGGVIASAVFSPQWSRAIEDRTSKSSRRRGEPSGGPGKYADLRGRGAMDPAPGVARLRPGAPPSRVVHEERRSQEKGSTSPDLHLGRRERGRLRAYCFGVVGAKQLLEGSQVLFLERDCCSDPVCRTISDSNTVSRSQSFWLVGAEASSAQWSASRR